MVAIAIVTLSLSQAPARPELDGWALRPVIRPEVPAASGRPESWARTPVDAFIAAQLVAKGLSPSPEADRRRLARRLTYDLTGLPPALEDVRDFEADASPDACERLVDRLLASPRHGERWARHWMDAVHFAETHGHDQDRVRENAWPYRDYLVASFNADKPYARFVEEQIAADALFPSEPGLVVALGMVAAGPWDESSLRDIREDSIDRQIGFYLDRDDMVATVISTFTSTTVHCARCHDHKFDPVSQEDYYGLQAVFAGVGRANRAYDPDPEVARRRAELRGRIAALARREPAALEALLDPAVEAEVAAWEGQRPERDALWVTLDPAQLTSKGGATLTELDDRSVRSGGARPEKDTYVVAIETDLARITGLRLELLADPALPQGGPGRNDNGNLHLSELRVTAAPRSDPQARRPVAIAAAAADFDQDGWTAIHAIDGNPATAWGIYPQVGKPHQAVFELATDVGFAGGTLLEVTLEQIHGGGHLIGCFRLAATTSSRPVRPGALPDAVAAAVATPRDRRSAEAQQAIAAWLVRGRLERDLAALPPERLVYAIASDFLPDGSHKPLAAPRAVHLLGRGEIQNRGKEAAPGSLSCVAGLPGRFDVRPGAGESERRAALARWIADTRNPLTWRSIANRIWHHHFGRGLVDTPNDLGRMGGVPSHPELLDWLAAELAGRGGSLKAMHRLLVTSAAYRQAAAARPDQEQVDGENRSLWRGPRRRLDAEEIHDAVCAAADRLDLTMGGPSVQHFAMSPGIHVTPVVDYSKFDWTRAPADRRSVYRFIFRTLPDPFIEALDGPDASQLTAARPVSMSPLQALALLNDPFMVHHAEAFAARLRAGAANLPRQVERACEIAWHREPTAEEREELEGYASRQGLAGLCRILINSSEMLFVD